MPIVPGADHDALVKTLENYAALLRRLKRDAEAKRLEARAKSLTKTDKP